MFVSKNILFYDIVIYLFLYYYYYFMIFYPLHCSIDCKYEYFCTTGNKSFKCVFLKFILVKLANGISHVLVDLKFGGDLHRMYLCRMNHGFQNLNFFFFLIFVYHPKDKKQIVINKKGSLCNSLFEFRECTNCQNWKRTAFIRLTQISIFDRWLYFQKSLEIFRTWCSLFFVLFCFVLVRIKREEEK